MRVARRKLRGQAGYYHLYNRVTGPSAFYPLDDNLKEYAFRLVEELADYFTLEIMSVCWLGNHFHLVVYAPAQPPDLATAARRHNAYYAKRGDQYDPVSHQQQCTIIAARMIDISFFMSQLQQRVTKAHNRHKDWDGILWNERFKSAIIGGDRNRAATIAAEEHQPQKPGGVWRCVKYVEMNPVRAGLANAPGAYRYSTWGRFCGNGTHPFGRHFVRHMKLCLGDPVVARWSARQLYDEFQRQLVNEMAEDAALFSQKTRSPNAPTGESTTLSANQAKMLEYHGRYWIHGGIIGTAQFIEEVLAHLASQRPRQPEDDKLPVGSDPPVLPRQFPRLRVGDRPDDDDRNLHSYHRPYGRQRRACETTLPAPICQALLLPATDIAAVRSAMAAACSGRS